MPVDNAGAGAAPALPLRKITEPEKMRIMLFYNGRMFHAALSELISAAAESGAFAGLKSRVEEAAQTAEKAAQSVRAHNNHNEFWSSKDSARQFKVVDKNDGRVKAVFRFDGANWNLDNKNGAYTDMTRGSEHISIPPNGSHELSGGGWQISFYCYSMFCHYAAPEGIFVSSENNAVQFQRA